MSFAAAVDAFRIKPCNKSAADFLRALLDEEAEGKISGDLFLDGLAELHEYLSQKETS